MENKLNNFISMISGRVAFDKAVTKDCEISQAIYNRIQQDIKEIMEELNVNNNN